MEDAIMSFLGMLGNAFKEAGKGALIQVALTQKFAGMDDQSLLDLFDQLEEQKSDYEYMDAEEKKNDEKYTEYVRLKQTLEETLQKRGYSPKTIYTK
jgi:hypothetical protein